MQEAKIDKYGRLIKLFPNKMERLSQCRIFGRMPDNYEDLFSSCDHDCPGWEELDMFVTSSGKVISGPIVTLNCMPGKPTYKIVEDERQGK